MTVDAGTFRSDFPEFADGTAYPDSTISFFIALAGKLLNPDRWYDLLDYATELYVAHNLVLSSRNVLTSEGGGIPGMVMGPQRSKTVDDVIVSYDTSAITLDNGGFWNLTTYGVQLLQLIRMAGSGGYQVGACF